MWGMNRTKIAFGYSRSHLLQKKLHDGQVERGIQEGIAFLAASRQNARTTNNRHEPWPPPCRLSAFHKPNNAYDGV